MPETRSDIAKRAKEAVWRAADTWRESMRAAAWDVDEAEVVSEVQELLDKTFEVVRGLRDADAAWQRTAEAAIREVRSLPETLRAPAEEL